MGNHVIAPAEPTVDLSGGPESCPSCSHGNDAARRSWWDKRRGRTLAKCRRVTVEQDALVDYSELCACTDAWHQ